MLEIFENELFKEIEIDDRLKLHYAISNFGRLVSYKEKLEDGRIVKGSLTEGYRIFRYKIFHGKEISYKHRFFCKLVAERFLEKTSDDQTCLLHLDHNRSNDNVSNLKWATKQEMLEHHSTSQKVKRARKKAKKRLIEYSKKRDGFKLTTTKVIHIKTLLANPERKTRMKMIARQFGVSEMQIYRIKSGKNWGHVNI